MLGLTSHHIAVVEGLHGTGGEVGVGEVLLGALVGWCRDRGCLGVDSTALPGHRATKNFFEEQGFVARSIVMHHRFEA